MAHRRILGRGDGLVPAPQALEGFGPEDGDAACVRKEGDNDVGTDLDVDGRPRAERPSLEDRQTPLGLVPQERLDGEELERLHLG